MWARIDSMTTTEPSTKRPKSIAPRLMRLPVIPTKFIPLIAINIEIGMAKATISAARTLPNKTKTERCHERK
jgi:hypothetical protein